MGAESIVGRWPSSYSRWWSVAECSDLTTVDSEWETGSMAEALSEVTSLVESRTPGPGS